MSKNGHLSSAGKQAAKAVNGLLALGTSKRDTDVEEDKIRSVGTSRQYQQIFTTVAEFLEQEGVKLRNMTPELAEQYLEVRCSEIQQKQLNNEITALEKHLRNVRDDPNIKLDRAKSGLETITNSRAYTVNQINYLLENQTESMALATRIAIAAGLRPHELLTLQQANGPNARAPSTHREWSNKMHTGGGRESWVSYTVAGKGGLKREVRLPPVLSEKLEKVRLEDKQTVQDRKVFYTQEYNLPGGQSFSNSWSKSSIKNLGFSNGAHGLRHSYAQLRMKELQEAGFKTKQAKLVLSQELGHFRAEIVDIYLR